MAYYSRAVKRLTKDIQMVYHEKLENENIFISVSEENIFHVKAMILGPKDTPYEYGYYFFDLIFGEDYPENPPVAKFKTTNGRIRFNPNLYAEGKVCLSILNTFSGPTWTLCQNLKSILLVLQTVLNDNPLCNEPGFEIPTQRNINDYENYKNTIRYYNYSYAIQEMLINTPFGFEMFIPLMQELFIKNYNDIIKGINLLTHLDNHVYKDIYMKTKVNFSNIIPLINNLYSILQPTKSIESNTIEESKTIEESNTIEEIKAVEEIKVKEVKKQIRPIKKAKDYEDGYVEEFEGNKYVVYSDKKNSKRWKKQV